MNMGKQAASEKCQNSSNGRTAGSSSSAVLENQKDSIDMTITLSGTIKVKKGDGAEVVAIYMKEPNANTVLHTIGESYGVRKLKTDSPHWSFNGR